MANVETKLVTIHIADSKPVPMWKGIVRLTLFLVLMIVGIGLSKTWFGGSWVIDILCLILIVTILCMFVGRGIGYSVAMTFDQARAWIEDGAPADAKGWLDRKYPDR